MNPTGVPPRSRLLVAVAAVLLCCGTAGEAARAERLLAPPAPDVSAAFPPAAFLPAATTAEAEAVLVSASGRHAFVVEIADTVESRSRGLMFRDAMAADHGMLFDFGTDQNVAFWMKNTILSLDMIFVRADGTIASIAPSTVPFSLEAVPSGAPVRFVLEVVAGTAARLGLEPGDRMEHPRIRPR